MNLKKKKRRVRTTESVTEKCTFFIYCRRQPANLKKKGELRTTESVTEKCIFIFIYCRRQPVNLKKKGE